jgi:hypothetical protein
MDKNKNMNEKENFAHLHEQMRILKQEVIKVQKEVERNGVRIEDILKWIAKSKGFVGGVMLVLGVLWGIALFLKTWIVKLLVGG